MSSAKPITHLAIESGPVKLKGITVSAAGFQIGRVARGSRNDLVVDDETLSREHCRFFFRGGALWVSDLKSANGTLVDGAAVDSTALAPNQLVDVGNLRIRVLATVQTADGPEGEDTPAAPAGKPVLRLLAWVALLVWWAFLAFSLLLPPPPSPEPPVIAAAAPLAPPPPEPAQAEPAEVTTPEPVVAVAPTPAEHPALADIKAAVATHLLNEDFAGAARFVQAQRESAADDLPADDLAALADYLENLQRVPARIATALAAQAGNHITLRSAATNVDFLVDAVAGSKLSGRLTTATGPKAVSLDIAKLHPADRLDLLGPAAAPEDSALRAVLAHKSKAGDRALAEARAAGLLADALTQALGAAP